MTLHRIVDLLRTHLPADDVLAPYADRLATLDPTPLRGYLTGSIDAVLRLSGPDGPRFVIVRLQDQPHRARRGHHADFTREAMGGGEMMRSHYPLQALLYAVALAPVSALAPARVRPGDASGWGAVPVRARHGRPRHPGRCGGVRLGSPARRAGGGTVGSAGGACRGGKA